jgi:hypothetical protein
VSNNQQIQTKIEDYKIAQALVNEHPGDDLHFYLLMLEYLRLPPEQRLAKGLARGRRKYFIITK